MSWKVDETMEYIRKRSLEVDDQIQLAAKRREQNLGEKGLEITDEEPLQFPSVFTRLTSKDRVESRLQEFINFGRRFSTEPFRPIEDADRYTVVLALLVFLLMNHDSDEEIELKACAALKYAALGNTYETAPENSESKHSSLKQMSRTHGAIFSLLCSNDVQTLDLVGHGLVASAHICGKVEVFINIRSVFLQLIKLLSHSSSAICYHALRIFGETIHAVDYGNWILFDDALPPLKKLLIYKEGYVRGAACRLLYSFILIDEHYMEAVRQQTFMVPLVKVLQWDRDHDRAAIALRIIYKAMADATCEQIRNMVTKNCIHGLCRIVKCSRNKGMVRDCIAALYIALKAGEEEKKLSTSGCNDYVRIVNQTGAWTPIKGWILEDYKAGGDDIMEYIDILEYYVAEDDELMMVEEEEEEEEEELDVSTTWDMDGEYITSAGFRVRLK